MEPSTWCRLPIVPSTASAEFHSQFAHLEEFIKKLLHLKPMWLSAAMLFALSAQSFGGTLINPGFEAGFTAWSRVDQLGSEGTFALQTGTSSPVTATVVPAPPGGTLAAMTDAEG